MAFTRFKDDPCRIKKQLQESTDIGRYIMNVPGPGNTLSFANDPFIRLQKNGGNIRSNVLSISNNLKGLDRKLNRDCLNINEFNKNIVPSCLQSYNETNQITQQSRAFMPAWNLRDKELIRWNYLPFDPQKNIFNPLINTISSRINEKDNYEKNNKC